MKNEKEKIVSFNLRMSVAESKKIERMAKKNTRSKNETIRHMIQTAKG